MKTKNGRIVFVLLAACVTQMAANGIAPSLAEIQKAFPALSDTATQCLTTLPSLWVVVMCLSISRIAEKIQKRWLITLGCSLVASSGVLGVWIHDSIWELYLWASVLGIGIGITVPMIPVITSMYFTGEMQGKLLGLESSMANASMILMTVIGGLLTAKRWNYNYLVYLLALPAAVSSWKLIPRETTKRAPPQKEKKHIKIRDVLPYVLVSGLITMLFNTVPTNASILIEARNLGGSSISGVLIAVLMTGGALGGVLFGALQSRLGNKVMAVGFIHLTIGLLVVSFAQNLPIMFAGTFLAGTAITCVMPQCSRMAAIAESTQAATASVGLVMAGSNLGGFCSPLITAFCSSVLGRDEIAFRFWSAAVIAVVIAGVILVKDPNWMRGKVHTAG